MKRAQAVKPEQTSPNRTVVDYGGEGGRRVITKLLQQALPFVTRVGADPGDSDELRLQKSSLVLGALMFIVAGALWGVLYFLFGQRLAGSIPLAYAIFSFLSVIAFHLTRQYRFFLFSQLLLILFLPFLLMLALGG